MPLSTDQSIQTKRVLVCPLNWGLGHAARDIPLIERLVDKGHRVILAGAGPPLELLRGEFPELETVAFSSTLRIRYSRRLPAWLKITFLSPALLYEIFAEHFRLKRILRQVKPDVIISDNRYGLWNRRVRTILITHQLSIRLPRFTGFLEYPAYLVLKALIEKFDRCWIPDYPGPENLSGDLSHRYPLPFNAVFIGAVSRFHLPGVDSLNPLKSPSALNFDMIPGKTAGIQSATSAGTPLPSSRDPLNLLVLLSGPEPQRSQLQKIILKQLLALKIRCIIMQGFPGKVKRCDLSSTVTAYSHLPSAELRKLILSAENIICRGGYTSIMDLALMQKKAMLIPTPGQTEQEYLAVYLSGKGMFLACSQHTLELVSAISDLGEFTPEFNLPSKDFLEEELQKLL